MSKQLCPKCKTGAESYKLDPKSEVCPYLRYHNGKSCPFFSPIEEGEVNNDEGVLSNNYRDTSKIGSCRS